MTEVIAAKVELRRGVKRPEGLAARARPREQHRAVLADKPGIDASGRCYFLCAQAICGLHVIALQAFRVKIALAGFGNDAILDAGDDVFPGVIVIGPDQAMENYPNGRIEGMATGFILTVKSGRLNLTPF